MADDRGFSRRKTPAAPIRRRCVQLLALLPLALFLAAAPVRAADDVLQKYPDILAAKVQSRAGNRFDFDVTVSSPYDTPQRYADAFRVRGANGRVYATANGLWSTTMPANNPSPTIATA
ncbi:hypothetical protein [Accumulibacter sp.]|uniref:hypothetical protein n=1 Tax=Accumulibacter sp. TaxID=2053492 RepID=UPI002629427B|nr:hypothetical protein [Accumulibacter sp.]